MKRSSTLYADFFRRAENTLNFENCDSGVGIRYPTENVVQKQRRMLPFTLVACLEGASIELTTAENESVIVPSGRAFFVKSHEPHARTLFSSGCVKSSWAHLRCTIMNTVDIFSFVHPPRILPEKVTERFLTYNGFMADGKHKNEDPQTMYPDLARRRAYGFDLLASLFECSEIDPRINEIFTNITRLNPVLQHIHEKLEVQWTREQLASLIHVSPSRLDSLFHETTGKGAIAYLVEQRIGKAGALLLTSNRSVQEIASDVGCDNVSYFTRLFKKHTGVTPTKYRKDAWDARDSLSGAFF